MLNIVLLQSYRADGELVGTLRLQLQAPAAEYRRTPEQLPYCGHGEYFSDGGWHPQYPCKYDDALEAVFPSVETNALFLTTRQEDIQQNLPPGCPSPDSLDCSYVTNATETSYLAQPALFTLLIDHSVSAPSIDISDSAFHMDGRIAPPGTAGSAANDGDEASLSPCEAYSVFLDPPAACDTDVIHVGVKDTFDIVPLGSLMIAAGVRSLDANLTDAGSHAGEARRNSGSVFVVTINYDNYVTYFPSVIKYAYSVSAVKATEFKALETLPAPGASKTWRHIINRHGLRFIFLQSGRLGVFSLPALLVQLVSSFGLIAVSSAIVQFLAFNVLAMRFIYSQYATVTSVDFSDIDHIEAKELKRFKNHDLINPRPAIFARIISFEERAASAAAAGRPFTAEQEESLRHAAQESKPVSVASPLSERSMSGSRTPLEYESGVSEDEGTGPARQPWASRAARASAAVAGPRRISKQKGGVSEHWRPTVLNRRGKP